MTEEMKIWWNTIDKDCPFRFQMFGTPEQRIQQLYIIRNIL